MCLKCNGRNRRKVIDAFPKLIEKLVIRSIDRCTRRYGKLNP